MPRGLKKENLPSKVCVVCERPFTWRKKWERCWDEVSTCSKSCNAKRRSANKALPARPGVHQQHREDVEGISGQEDGAESSVQLSNARDLSEGAVHEEVDHHRGDGSSSDSGDSLTTGRERRKAAKKAAKAARRAQREGRGGGGAGGQKQCDGCSRMVDLLVRCTVDESQQWRMMCGKCWQGVSGGVVDGDADHPHYRYGGLWKNRRANKAPSTTPP